MADIAFIVDVSDSTTNTELVRGFLSQMINSLTIESNSVRVGIVLYSDTPSADYYLNTFSSKSKILQYIKRLLFGGAESKTSRALKFAREKVFAKELGSRHAMGVQQIAVVITEVKSLDDVAAAEAAKLIRSGVKLYALGVTNDNVEVLQRIASYPPTKFVFSLQSFSNLDKVEKKLWETVCHMVHSPILKSSKYDLKEGRMFHSHYLYKKTIHFTTE